MRLWFNCVLAITISLVPAIITLNAHLSSIPIWLTLIIFSYLLLRVVTTRPYDYLYSAFLCFMYVFMILAPLLQMESGGFPWVDFYTTDTVQLSWWVTATALACFELGYIALRAGMHSAPRPSYFAGLVLSPGGGQVLFLAAMGLCLLGLVHTGVDKLFLPRNDEARLVSGKIGVQPPPLYTIINALTRVPPVFIMQLFILDFFSRINRYPERPWMTANSYYMVIVGLTVAIINNPISAPRFWVGAIALCGLLLVLHCQRKVSSMSWFSLNLFILVLAFPIADMFRNSLDFNPEELQAGPTRNLVYSPDFDAFQQQMNVIVVTDKIGFQQGKQIASSILFFVPRKIWPQKGEPTGMMVANELGYFFNNLSSPLMSEFFIDGGIYAVIAGMFAVGMLYRYLSMNLLISNPVFVCFYCFFTAYQFYLLRGALMTVTNFLLVGLVACFTIYGFRRRLFINMPAPNSRGDTLMAN